MRRWKGSRTTVSCASSSSSITLASIAHSCPWRCAVVLIMATGLWPAATISDCVRRAPLWRRDKSICLELGGGQLGGGFLHRSSCGGVSGARPCRLRWRHPIGGGVDGRGGARGGDASGLSAASGLGGHAHWSRKVCVWFFGVSCISLSEQPEPAPRRFVLRPWRCTVTIFVSGVLWSWRVVRFIGYIRRLRMLVTRLMFLYRSENAPSCACGAFLFFF